MSKFYGWWTRLRRAIDRRAFDQQMAAEMREHLERETAQRVSAGEDPATARRHAAIEFGHADSLKEQVRDRRFGNHVEEGVRNVRFALRGLGQAPGFTVIALATIAIGIGAGTAVFSLVNAILLRSLPVPNPQELRVVHWSGTDVRMRSINQDFSRSDGNREFSEAFNHPALLQLREQAAGIADVFGFFPLRNVTAVSGRNVISADGLMVSDNFFSALGVRALIGRVFARGDDAAGRPNVVITHAVWQRHFAADPAVLGQTVTMQGVDFTVIGVLQRDFTGVRPGQAPGFYLPIIAGSPFLHVPLSEDWHWFIRLMARLRPGHTDAQLSATLSVIFAASARHQMGEPTIVIEPGQGGLGFDRDAYGKPLLIMLGVTGLVMLVACANVAGLSLARGASRQHEFAVRVALGSGRRRLIVQSLTESSVLAFLGASLGVLFAVWGRGAISGLLAGSADGLRYDLSLNRAVLGYSLAAAFVTALLSGLLPAWRAGRVDPLTGLKLRGTAGAPRLGIGRVLVAAQICVSVSILTGAGLGLRGLTNLRHIDPGFTTDNLVVFEVNPAASNYNADTLTSYYDRVQIALIAIPGVTNAALLDYALLSDRRSRGGFRLTYKPELGDEERWTSRLTVNESFFATIGIPVLDGRGFTAADAADAPRVIVVNEAFVRDFMDGQSPIGHTLSIWSADWRIVGVCRDAKLNHIKSKVSPTTYFPFRQRFYDRFRNNTLRLATFAVRSPLPAAALRAAIQQAVNDVDPTVPVAGFTTQSALVDRTIGQERLLAILCSALGGVALLLCCIGLYGLIAYDVTRRTGEIAIRMAIGAQRGDVARPILREALLLAAIGIGVGLPAALGVTQLIKSQLFGVSPLDPATIVAVVAILMAVTALAAWLPARRATRIDPLRALRNE